MVRSNPERLHTPGANFEEIYEALGLYTQGF
jgi:hypothetical protein